MAWELEQNWGAGGVWGTDLATIYEELWRTRGSWREKKKNLKNHTLSLEKALNILKSYLNYSK